MIGLRLLITIMVSIISFQKIIGQQGSQQPSVDVGHVLIHNLDQDISASTKDKSSLYALYVKACYQHRKGMIPNAFATYKEILAQKHPLYVYEGFVRLLFETGNFPMLVKLFKEKRHAFEKEFKKNVDLNIMFAQALLYIGNNDEAEQLFVKLAQEHNDNDIVAYYSVVTMMKKDPPAKVLGFISECLKKRSLKSKHFLFHFLAAKLYEQMHQRAKAYESLNKCITMMPHFDQALLFKAMLCEKDAKFSEAIDIYKNILSLIGPDIPVQKQLIHLLFTQKRHAEALEYLRTVPEKTPEHYFDVALLEINAKRPDLALVSIDEALKQAPYFAKAKLLKIESLLAVGRRDEVIPLVKQWLKLEPDNLAVINIALLLKKAKFDHASIIAMLEEVLKVAQSPYLYLVTADFCIEHFSYTRAKELYEQAQIQLADEQLKHRITYQIAYAAVKLHKNDEAKQLLETLIQKVAYADGMNLLAYLYAKEGKNLPKALSLVDKLLTSIGNKAEYMDTKGLILLKMGQKNEARSLFEKALVLNPESNGIKMHLDSSR